MKQANLEETLVQRVRTASANLEEKLFKQWLANEGSEDREQIYSKCKVLESLTFDLINSIRGNKDG